MQTLHQLSSCSACGGASISATWVPYTFDYGSGESLVKLNVRVPVRHCNACEFEYLDNIAERLKYNTICKRFGVLTPDEIRQIREEYRMTRATFAHLTGLDEALLNRWENGLSVQTVANDRYLRLLKLPQSMKKLQKLIAPANSANPKSGAIEHRFRVLEITETLINQQSAFHLHPTM